MLIQLSYPLNAKSPVYPGSPAVSLAPVKSIANGDSSNTSLLSFGSHSGTHIDVPLHFSEQGCSVVEILKPEIIFSPTICIELPKEPDSFITKSDLEPFEKQINGAEGILIRTGFFQYRENEPDIYTKSHPWIHPDVSGYLLKFCPQLKLVGFDTISISNPTHRLEGRLAHKAFLCGESPLLLLEDADLSDSRLLVNEFDLHVYPWILDKLDGTPVTTLAVL